MLEYFTKFKEHMVKIAVKDMDDHFKQRMREGRGNIDPAKRRALTTELNTLVRRMNANPELIKVKGRDGKNYTSSTSAVRKLPNEIGIKLPGGGIAVIENRRPANLTPNYTLNTLLNKDMNLRRGTVPMSLKNLYKRLAPEAFPKPKEIPAHELQSKLRRDFGFKGPGSNKRWDRALSEISKSKKSANETRAMLGSKPLGDGDKVLSTKPGPRPNIPELSANRTRKLTRRVLALASKGKLKLSSVLSSRQYLREVLARSLRQGASSSLG